MAQNSTQAPLSNSTESNLSESSSLLGLAVGLPIFFMALLLVGIAVFFWFRHRKSVDIELSNKLKTKDKSPGGQPNESHYSGYTGGLQPAPQSPIYENFPGVQSNLREFQSAGQSEDTHRDQAYLPCDPHDAIYSNDPALFHPDQAEISEDVYIMPDA